MGDELRLAGEKFLDSDAGGRTADERANAVRLLAMHDGKPAGVDDDDSDSDDSLVAEELPPRHVPFVAPRPAHAEPAANIRRQADPLPVVPPKPQSQSRAQQGKLRVTSKPKQPAVITSALPDDDEDEDEAYIRELREQNRGIQEYNGAVARGPPPAQQSASVPKPQAASTDTFTFPATPNEALGRYDECMTYMMEMMCELTHDNIHAQTARASLMVFRSQMLAWGKLNHESADWEKMATFMVMYVETFRMIIKSTAGEVEAARSTRAKSVALDAQNSQASDAPGDSASVVAQARASRESRVTERASVIPGPIPTDADVGDVKVAPRAALPPGTHLNPNPNPDPASENAKRPHHKTRPPRPAQPTPSYIARAEDVQPQDGKEGCGVM